MIARPAVVFLFTAGIALADNGAVKGTISGPTGPVPNAVVLLDGPSVPAAAGAPHVVVDQRNETFVPHVVAVAVGTAVDFPNHDGVLHNAFSASPAKKFDLGMYGAGESRSVTFDTPGVVRIGCNAHPKMEAFVVVHPNPYVAVTDAQGGYTVAGVPAGSYELRIWHETLKEQHVPVIVHDGQVETRDVRLAH
jgi:plastocyanin